MKEKKQSKQIRSTAVRPPAWTLTRTNYILFAAAALMLIIGYYFMSIGPANSFWSLTLSPIILVIAYCVLFPLAILWKPKAKS